MPYITPSTTPPSSNCRRLFVPNDTRMIAAILGQILELTEAVNWEQTTGISVAETTALWEAIYSQFSAGDFCMIGAIVAILNDTTPDNMLLCDGSTFAKVDYPELYDVLPAVLIIDADNGSVPNLREAFVRGASTTIVEHSTGGEKQHTLSVAEMPIHSHSYLLTAAGAGALPGAGIGNIPGVTGFSGSSASHNNIPPYYALKYVVVAR